MEWLQERVDQAKQEVGLGHITIEVSRELPVQEKRRNVLASIDQTTPNYAELRVGRRFFHEPEPTQRLIIAHELGHLKVAPLTNMLTLLHHCSNARRVAEKAGRQPRMAERVLATVDEEVVCGLEKELACAISPFS